MLRVFATRARAAKQLRLVTSRAFSTEAAPKGRSNIPLLLGLAGAGGGLYYAKENGLLDGVIGVPSTAAESASSAKTAAAKFKPDYAAVRAAIEDVLESDPDYDDGSFGPVLVRLAWHASGTYDASKGTGGSNGSTMRFDPESSWGANAGLDKAREVLEPIKAKFPWISYADLWTLAGATAVEAMGGPHINWRPGRSDRASANEVEALPDGLLPDGVLGQKHVRDVFGRMGFNDREMVALIGAHALGRCHTYRSGFDGPWTFSPTTFSNTFFTELKNNKWSKRKWGGPLQYADKTGELMMLNTDMALLWDKKFRKFVDLYAADVDTFFEDFAAAFTKLLELGVPFPEGAPQYV